MANAKVGILLFMAVGLIAAMIWIVMIAKKKVTPSPPGKTPSSGPSPSPSGPSPSPSGPSPSPPTPSPPSVCGQCPQGKTCITGNNQPYCDFPCVLKGPCSEVGALCSVPNQYGPGNKYTLQCGLVNGPTKTWGGTSSSSFPCTQQGYTVNKPWFQYGPADTTCYSPAGTQCCNLDPITNQCYADFSSYTYDMMKNWATSCGVAPPAVSIYHGNEKTFLEESL